jgi:hypothetical protein
LRLCILIFSWGTFAAMHVKRVLPILVLLTVAAFISTPILTAHPAAADPIFITPSIQQGCGGNTCSLSSLQAGETIFFAVSAVPPYTVSDSMGNHFSVQKSVPLPGSALFWTIFTATVSVSAPINSIDVFTVSNAVGGSEILGLGISGATGVEVDVSASGNSTTPHVAPFVASQGALVIASLLMNSSLGPNEDFPSAGPGYAHLILTPYNGDEYAISSGNSSTAPFILGSATNWVEIVVAYAPSAMPVPQFDAPTILVASVGLVLIALMKKTKILRL